MNAQYEEIRRQVARSIAGAGPTAHVQLMSDGSAFVEVIVTVSKADIDTQVALRQRRAERVQP